MISESVHLRGEKKDYQPEVGADVRTAGRMKNDAMGDSSWHPPYRPVATQTFCQWLLLKT